MTNVKGFACFLLFTVTIAIGVLPVDLHHNLRDVDATAKHLDEFVSDASIDYAIKAEQINHIIYAARVTADQAGLLAIEQRAQLRKTSADSDKTVKALRVVIDRAGLLMKHTDEQLNAQALPQITAATEQNMNAIGDSARALTAQLNDPQIPALLGHFNTISGNLQIISGNSVAMSDDMRIAVHRLAQPPTKFHQFLDASYTTLKFGSLFIP
jgi:hypothetical protein